MRATTPTLTLVLGLSVALLTACTSNQITAKVDSQGGQVSITAGSGNVVQEPTKTGEQIRKELELKNREIELTKKEAELANREKELAQQKLADAKNELANRYKYDRDSRSDDPSSAPKQRRQPARPRPQSTCREQSSYYPPTTPPATQTSTSYQSGVSSSVSSYAPSTAPPVRSDPVVEHGSQPQVAKNSGNRELRKNDDDQSTKKGGAVKRFFKNFGIVAAGVGLGYAAGGGRGAAIRGGIGAGAVLFTEMRNKHKEKRSDIVQ